MIAAHRDQENLVHGHLAQSKQQPKTPGARYPKTPLKVPLNDENASTAFAGKNGPGAGETGATKTRGAKQALVTPMDTRNRAPLGKKTTNAKARTGQSTTVKDMIKQIEKTNTKPTTTQKPKQKPLEFAPIKSKLEIKPDEEEIPEDEEPEYAPPPVQPLPYESDVLPKGGLTFEGLKRENLFRGYYQTFHNPVDDDGVCRKDRELEMEMKAATERAIMRNDREVDELDWNALDKPETAPSQNKLHSETVVLRGPASKGRQLQPSTLSSRKAASTLGIKSEPTRLNTVRRVPPVKTARPPMPLAKGSKVNKPSLSTKVMLDGSTAAEMASRNTLGYNKGKAAATMVHAPRPDASRAASGAGARVPKLTTPAHSRQGTLSNEASSEAMTQPPFMSIFADEGDDEDLPPIRGPLSLSDDEDEEFEMKL